VKAVYLQLINIWKGGEKSAVKNIRIIPAGLFLCSFNKRKASTAARKERQTMKSVRTIQAEKTNGVPGRSEQRNTTSDYMDAIAYGVQVRLDERTSFSRRVTDETVNAARALGVSNSIIEGWAVRRLNRLARETERLQEIKALLDRTYRNKPAMAARTRV
jgi:hypothetical protein